jgi:PTH1 family peptidyl-tRNA hydrolase
VFNRQKQTTYSALIVGLGNPGNEYANTRHNAGFLAVEALLAAHGSKFSKLQCNALIDETAIGEHKVLVARPQTFMNNSGQAVKGLCKKYNFAPAAVLVIHDELDIAPGTLRLKLGGGHAGHNGLRSVSAAIGEDYMRLRVGIGRPPGAMPADRYVLQRLSATGLEELKVDAACAADVAQAVVIDGFVAAQNRYHAG